MAERAPFHAELADGPTEGHAVWLHASDGVRVRAAIWPKGAKGTVLILPGRSEGAEKYGRAAADLALRGYASVALDWRGQGLADRLLPEPMLGHVGRFRDYQLDLAALVQAVGTLGLPQPLYLLAHSMGGCIALRALIEGLPVKAAALTAPMWGLRLSGAMRPIAQLLAAGSRVPPVGRRLAPGTSLICYAAVQPFAGNLLTSDPDMYAYLQRQTVSVPALGLGGPTLHWAAEALRECRSLRLLPSPDTPCVAFLGSRERIVDDRSIRERMQKWPGGTLEMVRGAEHEVLMETPAIRKQVFDRMTELFAAHR